MTSLWRVASLIPMIVLMGCQGNLLLADGETTPFTASEPCTDPVACCPQENMRCTGDPDRGGIVCRCVGLWDCSGLSPNKCNQEMPVPAGGGGWRCSWSEFSYSCTAQGDEQSPPGGGGGWDCVWNPEASEWICVREEVPNPTNTPEGGGAWNCSVDSELGDLICFESNPEVIPPNPQDDPPQDDPPEIPSEDPPPQKNEDPPPPPEGAECIPGQKRWCDGEQYCGWGQVTCKADGTWEEVCMELSDGRRPNTTCGCFNFYFDEECCETADCILPAGTDGQLCNKSAGQLCDYCNPEQPECAEAGAQCIVSFGSAFCGRACSASDDCPAGYSCIPYVSGAEFGSQCMPDNNSCY